jgi:hypothetical protein
MLEHCVPSDHADALAGDLLEDFRAGRSDGWYWRQTLSACAVAWAEGLRVRMPLVFFALIWSMLAPAWKVFIDGVQNAPVIEGTWPIFGGLWIIPAFILWAALNSAFLWAGILVYYVANTSLGKVFPARSFKRAFFLAPIVFAPIYAATMVWAALYWYSFFGNAKLAPTLMGQIADLHMLADVIRLPYFITLLCALWRLVPLQPRASQALTAEAALLDRSSDTRSLTLAPQNLRRFIAFTVGAGLINAMIASFILCRLPAAHAPDIGSLFLRAIAFVAIGTFAGILGTWLYWYSPASPFRADPPLPFPLFALACAAGWVWVPSMAMFSEQLSGATAVVAGIGAFFLAVGLRQSTFSVLTPATEPASVAHKNLELFAESLYQPRAEAYGHVIAVSLFAACMALAAHQNLIAAGLLASGMFLFAWKKTLVLSAEPRRPYRKTALRLSLVVIPAILVTVWALLDGVAHRNRLESLAVLAADQTVPASDDTSKEAQPNSASRGTGGFESLILWPFPEKKPIIPPVPQQLSFLTPGTTQPLIIRFDGPYWYLQPPDKHPGPSAHQAHGTPLSAEIRSINDLPLVMDAHQPLGISIPLTRCGKISVEIENRENRSGSIQMAVLLTDASSPGKPDLYLGQVALPSSQPRSKEIDLASTPQPPSAMNTAPVVQTLEFSIPSVAKIRAFNEITVMLLPDNDSAHVGPEIAVRQFQLFPR